MAQILGIPVKKYNNYRTGKVVDFPLDKEQVLVRGEYVFKESVQDKTYTVNYGDTLWSIAYSQYLNKVEFSSRYWWVVAAYNNILEPTDISALVGTTILIPDLATFELNN